MTNEQLGPGKDILSYCGKCKLTLAHVIVNMKKPTVIGKCQCKTCSAEHNYRDPEAVGKKRAPKAAKKESVPVEQVWQDAVAKAPGAPKPYATDKTFKEGDLINHPVFGKGIVEKLVPTNKIQTLFENGSKLLVCSR